MTVEDAALGVVVVAVQDLLGAVGVAVVADALLGAVAAGIVGTIEEMQEAA